MSLTKVYVQLCIYQILISILLQTKWFTFAKYKAHSMPMSILLGPYTKCCCLKSVPNRKLAGNCWLIIIQLNWHAWNKFNEIICEFSICAQHHFIWKKKKNLSKPVLFFLFYFSFPPCWITFLFVTVWNKLSALFVRINKIDSDGAS